MTICTGDRQNLLWNAVGADIIRQQMEDEDFVLHLPLSEYGRIAEQGILNIPQCYPSVTVEKYCIMPNHIHMILSFSHDCGRLIAASTLSRVVGQMKRWVSKQIGAGIWQKSYYERVIRNGTEYEEIWRYIQ